MDIEVLETGNGGDILRKGKDLSMVFSFENMPYLALFGGNVEAVTGTRVAGEQAFDYWGNTFLETESLQFNSITEKTLMEIPLNSSGRLIVEEAIKTDLRFMEPFADVTVSTEIIGVDHLRIAINVIKPDNLEEKKYIYIWEAGQLTILDQQYSPNLNPVEDEFLQYELQFYL